VWWKRIGNKKTKIAKAHTKKHKDEKHKSGQKKYAQERRKNLEMGRREGNDCPGQRNTWKGKRQDIRKTYTEEKNDEVRLTTAAHKAIGSGGAEDR